MKHEQTVTALRAIADFIKQAQLDTLNQGDHDKMAIELGYYVQDHAVEIVGALRLYADTLPESAVMKRPSELQIGDQVHDERRFTPKRVIGVGPDDMHDPRKIMLRIYFNDNTGWSFVPGGIFDDPKWELVDRT
jgi:hypothetical protein